MYKLTLLVLLHCYWPLSPPTFLRENVLWQFRSSLQLSKDTPHVGVLCTSVVFSLVSRLRNWCVQLGSWGVPSSPAWGDLNYLVDLDLSLFCVHGLCRTNSVPQTSFSYSRACATLCLCLCSALSVRCVCLAHGADYRVKSAEPIPWIWDIVLLPEFWGFFLLLLLFPSCNLTVTDVLFFFPKIVEIYLPLSGTFSGIFIHLMKMHFHWIWCTLPSSIPVVFLLHCCEFALEV